MATYQVTGPNGSVFEVESERELSPQELQALVTQDSFAENVLDVAGEFAAKANETLMWPVDTAIEGVNMLTGADIPTTRDLPGADGGFMEPGVARAAVQGAGMAGPAALAGVQTARNVAKVPGAAAEFMGFGTSKPVVLGAQIDPTIAPNVPNIDPSKVPVETRREVALLGNSSNPARAGYRRNEVGEVVRDQAQRATQKAGVSDDLIALVESANPQERRQMLRMVDAVGEADPVVRSQNSPRMALADSMSGRVQNLLKANEQAYKAQRKAISDLRGIRLDDQAMAALNDGPMQSLQNTLADFNVTFDPAQGALDFRGSSFETSSEAQGRIRSMLNLLYNNQPKTAHDLHIFKENVDELIEWSVSQGGAKSKSMVPLKQVRSDVNSMLRSLSSDYAMANEMLSETIPLLDDLQRLAGKNTDIRGGESGPALARLSRRILSNAQSAEKVDDVLQQLSRYGGDEDVWRMNVFLDELDGTFGSQQRRALSAEVNKAVELGLQAVQGDQRGVTSRVMDYAASAFQKSPEEQKKEQLAALRKLIVGSLEP